MVCFRFLFWCDGNGGVKLCDLLLNNDFKAADHCILNDQLSLA